MEGALIYKHDCALNLQGMAESMKSFAVKAVHEANSQSFDSMDDSIDGVEAGKSIYARSNGASKDGAASNQSVPEEAGSIAGSSC